MIYLPIFTHVCLHLTVYIYLRGELEKGWALGITYVGVAAGHIQDIRKMMREHSQQFIHKEGIANYLRTRTARRGSRQ